MDVSVLPGTGRRGEAARLLQFAVESPPDPRPLRARRQGDGAEKPRRVQTPRGWRPSPTRPPPRPSLPSLLTAQRQLDARHRLFRRNQTVIDLGFAPGSWSQVAQERTKPHGIVVGIDLIPAQPPRGVTAIQGDFLSPQVRRLVRDVCVEQVQRKRREERERKGLERKFEGLMLAEEGGGEGEEKQTGTGEGPGESTAAPRETVEDRPSYIDMEKIASHDIETAEAEADKNGRMVDVSVLRAGISRSQKLSKPPESCYLDICVRDADGRNR